ncbi:MAG TPA: T9SS type A sorting domain-containing protein [Candidatus Kapabacteria bacterium]
MTSTSATQGLSQEDTATEKVIFADTVGVVLPLESFVNNDTPSCGIWYEWGQSTHSNQQQQGLLIDTLDCQWLQDRVNRNSQSNFHQRTVDTGKIFIEKCANYDGAWGAFSDISYSLDFLKTDSNRYINYVGWLKDVLYLNTIDSLYWCADVSSLVYTFHYVDTRGRGDGLGAIAILKYVKESGRCIGTGLPDDYEEDYRFYMDDIIKTWRDTVTDSIATPLDTTLPSLEDLDLQILRGKSGVASGGAVSNAPRLSYVTAERNPFTDEVALKVELTTSTMLRLDIFDELGRSVYGEGLGYKQKGDHRFSVNGNVWSDGVYYARISTSGGEIRTVKLIKQ